MEAETNLITSNFVDRLEELGKTVELKGLGEGILGIPLHVFSRRITETKLGRSSVIGGSDKDAEPCGYWSLGSRLHQQSLIDKKPEARQNAGWLPRVLSDGTDSHGTPPHGPLCNNTSV